MPVTSMTQKENLFSRWLMKLSYGYLTTMVSSSLQDILQPIFSVLFNFLWKHFPLHFADLDSFLSAIELNLPPLLYCCRRQKYWRGNVFSAHILLTWRYDMQFWLKKIMFVLHQLNQIRDSLAVMGDNSTAFSLPQVRQPLIFHALQCN